MRLLISLFLLFAIIPLTAQERWEYDDFTDGKKVTVDGITYIIDNQFQDMADQLKMQVVCIRRIDEPAIQFERFGEYPDGTFCNDPEESAGIIRHRQEIPLIIHAAWKKAFSKEEREAHPEITIWAFPTLDMQGKIVAMAFSIPIFRDYVIQPEQIATLDRELRANLQFELKIDETNKFVRIPGQFGISFKGLSKMLDVDVTPNPDALLLLPTPSAGGGKTSNP